MKLSQSLPILILFFTCCFCTPDPVIEPNPEPNPTPSPTPNPTPTPKPGDAPVFNLLNTSGDTVKSSTYIGKVLVIFFFGNTCPFCIAVGPKLQTEIANVYHANPNFRIIGIDAWDGNLASVKSFQTNTSISFPLCLNGGKVADDYDTTYDRIVIVDTNNNIVYRGSQRVASDINNVKLKLESLLK